MNPLDWSLIGGPVPVVLVVVGLAGTAWLIGGRAGPAGGRAGRAGSSTSPAGSSTSPAGSSTSPAAPDGQPTNPPITRWPLIWAPLIAGVMAGLVITLAWLIDNVWRPFPDRLPTSVLVWAWAAVAAVALTVARVPMLRSWPRRGVALLAGVFMLLGALNEVNGYYQQYPTLRAALGPWLDPAPMFVPKGSTGTDQRVITAANTALASVWHPPSGMPNGGKIFRAYIPGTVSGFHARAAYIYLPPAYLTASRPLLPVLVLLAGQPGDTRNWVDSGRIQAVMDGFASTHNGLAPVVVMPDDLGSEFADPLCLDSRLGRSQTYLTTDVPHWIVSHLQVRAPMKDHGWAVAGFSDGGTCALQLATQAPHLYPVFLDISGQRTPSLGSPERTIRTAFGGNVAAFDKVNPVDVMAKTRFTGERGLFISGDDDSVYTPQQRYVYRVARQAGMTVALQIIPGGHSWRVWRNGLARNVGWLAAQLGIIRPGAAR